MAKRQAVEAEEAAAVETTEVEPDAPEPEEAENDFGLFEPDFEAVRATVRMFPKADYEISVRNHSPFAFMSRKGDMCYGVDLFPKMEGKINSRGELSDEYAGEDVSKVRCFLHTSDSIKATKRVLMPLFGFSNDEEKDFNEWFKQFKWGVKVAENEDGRYFGSLPEGSGWAQCDGARVRVRLSPGVYEPEDGEAQEQQKFSYWKPANR